MEIYATSATDDDDDDDDDIYICLLSVFLYMKMK